MKITVSSIEMEKDERKFWDAARKEACLVCKQPLTTGKIVRMKHDRFAHKRCAGQIGILDEVLRGGLTKSDTDNSL